MDDREHPDGVLMVPDGVKDVRRTFRKIPEIMYIVICFGIFKIGVHLEKFSRLDLWTTGSILMES